jgi:hypothetical protein
MLVGAAAIAGALKVNSSLQKLDLGFIGCAGVAAIEESLERALCWRTRPMENGCNRIMDSQYV